MSSVRRNASSNGGPTLLANGAELPSDQRRWALAIIGQGALIDDDVRLGSAPGHAPARQIAIGRDARIRSGSAIDDGVHVGDRLETGRNVFIGADTVVGDDCQIADNTIIEAACVVGARVRV